MHLLSYEYHFTYSNDNLNIGQNIPLLKGDLNSRQDLLLFRSSLFFEPNILITDNLNS